MEQTHEQKAQQLAEKIASKAEGALAGLAREMVIMKWPPEYCAIMWGAVADIALRRQMVAEGK